MSESSFTVNCTLQWPYHVKISKKQKIFVTALERENMQLNSSERESRKNYKCAISPIIQLFFFFVQVSYIYFFIFALLFTTGTRTERSARSAVSQRAGADHTECVAQLGPIPSVRTHLRWVDKSSSSNLKLV